MHASTHRRADSLFPQAARLAVALLAFTQIAGSAALNDISLAQLYPPGTLQTVLLPRDQWRPFPPLADRAAWQTLDKPVRELLLQQGEEALNRPLPVLPATLYLEYRRVGNRSRFEAEHRGRRELLHALALAECVEAKGKYLDAIANAIWAICEESTWCYPAHIAAQKAGVGLPEVTEPIVDLFAAETGVSLAWTLYLLADELDKVSPRLRPRIEHEIQQRILVPCHTRNFGWMAFGGNWPENRPNNWNPWINASVLTANLVVETNDERRIELTHKILRSLDRFIQPYPADGGCDEGPGYWGHAGGSLLDNLELLHSASAGKCDVFGHPLIQEIGRFIYRAHICEAWFVPVGDCAAKLDFDRSLVFRYGKRINDAHLLALGSSGATVSNVLESTGGRYFGRQLFALFNLRPILERSQASPPLVRDVWLPSDDMQLMAARSEAGSCQGLYVAAWGAHNAQSHNHNDVGNFIVFADGQPLLVDAGAPAYTAQTFSSRRYELWPMQSAYHNLPSINGAMQSAGRRHAARQVKYSADDNTAELSMDLAPAYSDKANVAAWVRTVRLNRGKEVEITDAFELKEVSGVTSENLLTPWAVEVSGPGALLLKRPQPSGSAATVGRIEFNPAQLSPSVETISLDDARLSKTWGESLNRIVLSAVNPEKKTTWTIRIRGVK